jgi:hypothetical protein
MSQAPNQLTDFDREMALIRKGIQYLDAGPLEVLDVTGDHGQPVYHGGSRNQRVNDRQGLYTLLTPPGGRHRQ